VEQLSFGFREEPPAKFERLFFACQTDGGASLRVHRFAKKFLFENGLWAKPLRDDRLHVSIHHVADRKRLRKDEVFASQQAGAKVSMEAFDIDFAFIETFEAHPARRGESPRYPLVLRAGEGEICHLHRQLGDRMRENWLRAGDVFVPHMTLAYLSEPVLRRAITPIRVPIRDFALIHSRVGLTEYRTLGRWPLHGPEGGSAALALAA
jgi:RNA 2',3'-cyclic 3'-phosphodiesterase